MKIDFPYGSDFLSTEIDDDVLIGVINSKIHSFVPEKSQLQLVRDAMANPIGSEPLSQLAKGKKNIVIIASDHTRPVPSKFIIPPMLEEIKSTNPDADITILIATGCHRGTIKEELVSKFGEDIVKNEKIHIHDCDDVNMLVNIGTLPSGGECIINKLAYDADLLISEGFIEPHFFAGFSGGRKSVLPGIAARKTVLANHCSKFIASPYAKTGSLEKNPIHKDMLYAAEKAGLAFIVNVVINSKKEIIHAVAGDFRQAHSVGCSFLSGLCREKPLPSDIVITSNGGYPLDQNIYQAVKGMTAAEATVKEGGVIIMLAKSDDGHGGESFFKMFADESDIDKTLAKFLATSSENTVPDQWEAQILIRILKKARVVYVSDAPDCITEKFGFTPAHSLDEALDIARKILNNKNATVCAVPDGVSVIIK